MFCKTNKNAKTLYTLKSNGGRNTIIEKYLITEYESKKEMPHCIIHQNGQTRQALMIDLSIIYCVTGKHVPSALVKHRTATPHLCAPLPRQWCGRHEWDKTRKSGQRCIAHHPSINCNKIRDFHGLIHILMYWNKKRHYKVIWAMQANAARIISPLQLGEAQLHSAAVHRSLGRDCVALELVPSVVWCPPR